MVDYTSTLHILNDIISNDFERDLLKASFANLNDNTNVLRFNNFAYSIREFSRHILKSLAPDSEVLSCSWYKNETNKPDSISRSQRIKYAIQGGLSDQFVNNELLEIDYIDDLRLNVIKSFELLNKYTHINEPTFQIDIIKVEEMSLQVTSSLIEFAEGIIQSRKIIIASLEDTISEEFLNHVLTGSIDNIDILATHHYIESVQAEQYDITEIGSDYITIEASGFVDVHLQWGSSSDMRNDIGAEMDDSFPFSSVLRATVNRKFVDANVNVLKFEVDTDGWYE